MGGHDRQEYLRLTSTRNLLGRQGQLFLLFGMLSRNPEGRLCLEDGEGAVVLDMEDAVSRHRVVLRELRKVDIAAAGSRRRPLYGRQHGAY